MNFCLQDKKKAFEAQQEFIKTFSARVNDDIACVEMAELQASSAALNAMGLAAQGGTQSVWGMLVVCQKSLYFFAPPRELLLMSMVRAGDDAKTEEQIFCFNNLSELEFFASPKKWYQIYSTNKLEFSYSVEGRRVCGEFRFSKSAAEVLAKIRAALNL